MIILFSTVLQYSYLLHLHAKIYHYIEYMHFLLNYKFLKTNAKCSCQNQNNAKDYISILTNKKYFTTNLASVEPVSCNSKILQLRLL